VKPARTAAAITARRRQTQDKLGQVEQAIAQLRRERGRLTVRSIADRAGVSATFLYENSDARVLIRRPPQTARPAATALRSGPTSGSRRRGASAHSTPKPNSAAHNKKYSPSDSASGS
jgi:hypothetical protein